MEQVAYISEFQMKIPIAGFLFGKDIADYMNEAVKNIHNYRQLEAEIRSGNNLSAEKNAMHGVLMQWFFYEAKEGVKKRFDPFLSFKHLK